MGHTDRLVVVLAALTACRDAPTDRAPRSAPPTAPTSLVAPAAPIAPTALPPAPPKPVANGTPADDALAGPTGDAGSSVGAPVDGTTACVFVGGTARCTRCIVRSCRAALAACCASARCSAALPALGRCLTANAGNESALTGCWDQFNVEGGTDADPTLRACMERGPCGICEVPR